MFVGKIRSPELREKKRRRLVRLLVFYVTSFFALAVLIVLLLRQDGMAIKNIEVSGNRVENPRVLSDFAMRQIAGNYLYLVPKATWLFYPRKKIEDALLNNFKRLDDAEVSYSGDNTALLEVKERKPKWLWCEDQNCYFMDKNGLIFAKAPNFSGNVFLKTSGGISGEEIIGSTYAEGWNFGEMMQFVATLEERGFVPVAIAITMENDAEITLESGQIIKLSPTKSLAVAAADFENALASGLISSDLLLQYIDLRFDNKIFYKSEE